MYRAVATSRTRWRLSNAGHSYGIGQWWCQMPDILLRHGPLLLSLFFHRFFINTNCDRADAIGSVLGVAAHATCFGTASIASASITSATEWTLFPTCVWHMVRTATAASRPAAEQIPKAPCLVHTPGALAVIPQPATVQGT